MNLKKAALLLAATALSAVSSFAASTFAAPTLTPNNTTNYGTTAAPVYMDSTGSPLSFTVNPNSTASSLSCTYTVNSGSSKACGTPTLTPATSGAATAYSVAVTMSATGYTTKLTTLKFTAETQLPAPTFDPTTSTGPATVTPCVGTLAGTTVGGLTTYDCTPDTFGSLAANATIKYTTDGNTVAYDLANAKAANVKTVSYSSSLSNYPTIEVGVSASEAVVNFQSTLTGYISNTAVGYFGTSNATGHKNFIAAGSSAQFPEYALAFGGILGDGANSGGVCGSHHFTKSNGASAVDTRTGSTPADVGNLVIVWDDSATYGGTHKAPSTVCVYLSLDSTLGIKAFMNSNLKIPSEFLNITGTSGTSNSIAPFWPNYSSTTTVTGADENSIPSDVIAAAQGQPFNVGVTDIRPEDAKFATTRALGTLNATRTGLGYGNGSQIGSAVVSDAGTTFNVVNFAITGADPLNGSLQQPYTTVAIGAAPVMVLVNTTATTAGQYHFGDPLLTNISRFTLAGYLNGSITGTGSLSPAPLPAGVATAPVHVWLREPLSGTYNTMEFNIPNTKEIATSQEAGVDPTTYKGICTGGTGAIDTCTGGDGNNNSGNPLYIQVYPGTASTLGTTVAGKMVGVAGATRQRAIGTGEEVKQVALAGAGADNLGYSFWGYGNIKDGNNHASTTTKYLTVDGVDPIYATYTNGVVPTCTSSNYNTTTGCPVALQFPNVINGSYPIWSIYRAVIPNPAAPTAAQTNEISFLKSVLTQAEAASSTVQDFVPLTSMQVFRSHYLQAGVQPHNGNITTFGSARIQEQGGDVGGAVYTIQSDLDHVAAYGTSLLSGEIVNVKE